MENKHIINSLLDNDWYAFTQSQVVYFFFQKVQVKYRFILRDSVIFPEGFDKRLQDEINHLSTLKLTEDEYKWLKNNPNMYNYFLEWYKGYQFNREEVKITFENSQLGVEIEGNWMSCIFWETPILAIISELYFSMTGQTVDIRTVLDKTLEKGEQLAGIPFVEFGTRRRFSFEAQNHVINGFLNSKSKDNFVGTSNPYFSMKYKMWIVGTYSHQAVQSMQVLDNVENCDNAWLVYWRTLYGKMLNVALTDTLTTDHFLNSVDDILFRLLDGFRIDSGDPILIGWKIIKKLQSLGIDPKTKNIVFSDNLNPEKVKILWGIFSEVCQPIFGIGTNLTNDFGPKPLNMVIKMVECNGKSVIKLSDDITKCCGDAATIEKVKKELGI